MIEENSKLDVFVQRVKEYADERVKLYILDLKDKVVTLISSAALLLISAILGVFSLFFLFVALAKYISTYYNQPSLGYLVVGLFFVLLVILAFVNRVSWIQTPISNAIIKQIHDDED
ncbi:MAG: phage holin family protein [Bacteroidia bacterium]|jgi:uncharacterized protein YqhQ|nr:phage holin family protein [Bacteroidia bacterium]MBP6656339.1 phage holin family protein [Bacteroidia bacterium]